MITPLTLSRRITRAAALAVAGLLATASLLVAAAPDALADGGLRISNVARFKVDLKAGRVKVTERVTLTNQQPNRGNYYYYWNSYRFTVPTSASGLTVTSGGARLSTSTGPTKTKGLNFVVARFSSLRYGRSRTLELSYTLAKAPFRTDDLARVGKGFASFPVASYADPGLLDLQVIAPASADFDSAGSFEDKGDATTARYVAADDDPAGGFYFQVAVSNPASGSTKTVQIDGKDVKIIAFAGDKKWLNYTAAKVPTTAATLQDITGTPFPGTVETIREDVGIVADGYAGQYNEDDSEIRLSEDLDPDTLAHELAHGWANSSTCDGRWVMEGLAQDLSERTLKKLGEPVHRDSVSRSAKGAIPLTSWESNRTSTREDAYGYPASYAAMRKLLGGLSEEQYTALLTRIANKQVSYPAASYQAANNVFDYRALLDAVEDIRPPAASTDGRTPGSRVLTEWVLNSSTKVDWAARAKTRAAYAAFDAENGPWSVPLAVRSPMSEWSFAAARSALKDVGPLSKDAQAVADLSAAGGWPADSIKLEYEDAQTASDISQVRGDLTSAVSTLTALNAAQAKSGGALPVTALAQQLVGYGPAVDAARQNLQQRRLPEAAALAADAEQRADWVIPLTIGLFVGPLLVLAGATLLVVVRVRHAGATRRAGTPLTAPPALPSAPLTLPVIPAWSPIASSGVAMAPPPGAPPSSPIASAAVAMAPPPSSPIAPPGAPQADPAGAPAAPAPGPNAEPATGP